LTTRRMGNQNKAMKMELILKNFNVKCTYCQCRINTRSNFTLDHVVPLNFGGTYEENNVTISCYECNSKKSNKLLTEFIKDEGIEMTPEIARFL